MGYRPARRILPHSRRHDARLRESHRGTGRPVEFLHTGGFEKNMPAIVEWFRRST
jgi:hypothetical protein